MAVRRGKFDSDVFRQYLQVFDHNLKAACTNLPLRAVDDDLRRELEISSTRREREHGHRLDAVRDEIKEKERSRRKKEHRQKHDFYKKENRALKERRSKDVCRNEEDPAPKERRRKERREAERRALAKSMKIRQRGCGDEKEEGSVNESAYTRWIPFMGRLEEKSKTQREKSKLSRKKSASREKSKSLRRRSKFSPSTKDLSKLSKLRSTKDAHAPIADDERKSSSRVKTKWEKSIDTSAALKQQSIPLFAPSTHKSPSLVDWAHKLKSSRDPFVLPAEWSTLTTSTTSSATPSVLESTFPTPSAQLYAPASRLACVVSDSLRSKKKTKPSKDRVTLLKDLSAPPTLASSPTPGREFESPTPSAKDCGSATLLANAESGLHHSKEKTKFTKSSLRLDKAISPQSTIKTSSPSSSAAISESPKPSSKESASAALLGHKECEPPGTLCQSTKFPSDEPKPSKPAKDTRESEASHFPYREDLPSEQSKSFKLAKGTMASEESGSRSHAGLPAEQLRSSTAAKDTIASEELRSPHCMNLVSEQSGFFKPATAKRTSEASYSPLCTDLSAEQSKSSKPAKDATASEELRFPFRADLLSEQSRPSKPRNDTVTSEASRSLSRANVTLEQPRPSKPRNDTVASEELRSPSSAERPLEQSRSSKPAKDSTALEDWRSPLSADLPAEQSKYSKPAKDTIASEELRSPSRADLLSEQSRSSKPCNDSITSEASRSPSCAERPSEESRSSKPAKDTTESEEWRFPLRADLLSEQSRSSKLRGHTMVSEESRSPCLANVPSEQSRPSKPAKDTVVLKESPSSSRADLPSEESRSSKPKKDTRSSEGSRLRSSTNDSGVPIDSVGSAGLVVSGGKRLQNESTEVTKYAVRLLDLLHDAAPLGRLRRKDIGDSPEAQEEQAEINSLHFEENMNAHFQLVQRWMGTARGAAGGDNFEEKGYAAAVWGWMGYADPVLVADVSSVTVEEKTAIKVDPFVKHAVVFIENLPLDAATGVFFEVRLDGKDWGELNDGIAVGFARKDTAENVPVASHLLDLWGIGFVPLCPDSDSDFPTAVTLMKSNGTIGHLEPTGWETQDLRPGDTVGVWWSSEGIYFMRNLCVVAQIRGIQFPPPSDLLGFFDLTGCAIKATLLSNFTLPSSEFTSLDHTVGVAVGLSLMHMGGGDARRPAAFVQNAALERNHPEGFLYMVRVTRRGHGTIRLGFAKDASGTDATLLDLDARDSSGPLHLTNASTARGTTKAFHFTMVHDEDTLGLLLVSGKWILLHNYMPVATWTIENFRLQDACNEQVHALVELSDAGHVDFLPPTFATMFGVCTGRAVLTADRLTARVTHGASDPGLSKSIAGQHNGLVYSNGILVPRIMGFTFNIHVLIRGNICIGLTNEDVLDADDYEVTPPTRSDYAWFDFAGRVHPQGGAGSGGHFIRGTTMPEDGDWVQMIVTHGQSRALVFKNGERCGHIEVMFPPPYYAFVALDDARTVITL